MGGSVGISWRVTQKGMGVPSTDRDARIDAILGRTMASSIGELAPAPNNALINDEIQALQQTDPGFSAGDFLRGATALYLDALGALAQNNPKLLGARATQHFLDKFAESARDAQARPQLYHVTVMTQRPPFIQRIWSDASQQYITVHFTSTIIRPPAESSSGPVHVTALAEAYIMRFVTFARRLGATSDKPAAGTGVHCESCGAPLPPGAESCPYCATPVAANTAGWRIDELSASPYA
jgi:hypothetical protein